MQTFELQGPDGQTYEIQAENAEAAISAMRKMSAPAPNTNPGVSPEAPPEMILNPNTGQYTSRELLANTMQPNRAQAAQIGGMQGLSFGGADEAMGAANAATDGAEGYAFGREYTRASEDAARRDHPWITGGAEVAGGVGTALTYGLPAIANKGMGGAMLGGAGVGGAEGFAYGLMSGEGSARDRIVNALKMGGMGLAMGGAAPPITSAARGVGRMAGDAISGGVERIIGKGSQGRANRALSATLGRSGMSADDLGQSLMRAVQDGQGEAFVAADALGQAGQRRMSGIARAGGDASQEIADFLKQRQLDQPERVAGFVSDAFDGSDTASAGQRALKTARTTTANTNYGAARGSAAPVDVRGALSVIDDRIAGMQGSNVAGDSIDGRLAAFRTRLAANTPPEGTTAVELSDFDRVLGVKQDVQDAIGVAVRAGRNNEARELTKLQNALDAALEEASEGYRVANDSFREASRVIEAVDTGAGMTKPSTRAADNVATFSGMTPDEQAAARLGYGDRLLAKVESTAGETTNRARPFTSTKVQQEAGAIATDPDLFTRRIGRENTMHDTLNKALGGSRTADNLEDIADLKSYDSGMLVNLLTGQFRAAAQQGLQGASDALTGMNPETRRIVAQALMAKDETAFRKAISQAETSEVRRQIADALLRMGAQKSEYGGLVQ